MKFGVFGSQSYKKSCNLVVFFFSLLQKKEEEEEEGARPTAQSVFKVRLIKFDETKKVPVIKQVKDVVENINLVQVRIHFHLSILLKFF
jgi:ribosomal protein L7/L12